MDPEEKRYIVLLIVLLVITAGEIVCVSTGRLSVLSGQILIPFLAVPTGHVLAKLTRILLKNRRKVHNNR